MAKVLAKAKRTMDGIKKIRKLSQGELPTMLPKKKFIKAKPRQMIATIKNMIASRLLTKLIVYLHFTIVTVCYNISRSYVSPPVVIMTAGGFEPPRQLTASSCQDYCVCQLHHAVAEIGEGDLAKDCPSPKSPQLQNYHTLQDLSISKPIVIVAKYKDKPISKGVCYGCMP